MSNENYILINAIIGLCGFALIIISGIAWFLGGDSGTAIPGIVSAFIAMSLSMVNIKRTTMRMKASRSVQA